MCEKTRHYSLKQIGHSRSLLMGLAALWVTYSHCWDLDFSQSHVLNLLHLVELSTQIRDFGNAGVDIFLFLSGYGLFHSLSRNPDIRAFYSRRFTRILPPVLLVSMIYYGLTGSGQPVEYLFHVAQISIYHPHFIRGAIWYFSLLIPLYLIYPFFHRVIDRYALKGALGLIALLVGLSIGLRALEPSYFEKIEIVLMRIPVFIAGIAAAKIGQREATIPSWGMVLICVFTVLYFLAIPLIPVPDDFLALERYRYFPLAIGFCLSVSFVDSLISDNLIRRLIVMIGGYSMEIYLLFEIVYQLLREDYLPETGIGIPYAIACFALTMLLALGLRKCSEVIVRALRTPGKGKRSV